MFSSIKSVISKFLIFTLFSTVFLYTQPRIGDWGALTSTIEINDIVGVGNDLFLATSGGFYLRGKHSSNIYYR